MKSAEIHSRISSMAMLLIYGCLGIMIVASLASLLCLIGLCIF
jgi:hypothetical protein